MSWAKERSLFTDAYLRDPTNVTAFTDVPPPGVDPEAAPPGQSNGWATEDCLFLDLIVPISVFNDRHNYQSPGYCSKHTDGQHRAAPVLFRMFPGGYYSGDKTDDADAAGLVGRSIKNPSSAPGMIYVSINYRLGALGWLAGPSFAAQGGQVNAGLYDQRLALDWVQHHIHLFGGDPGRVTLSGTSAGASSTMLHATAFNGEGEGKVAPFHQIMPFSPAININPYNWVQEATYMRFLKAAGVKDLAELRALSSEAVIAANELTIWQASYGSSGGYGPVVDGEFVPAAPTLLLQQGRFSKNIKALFSGHNFDEGLIFTPPNLQNDTALQAYVHNLLLPDAPSEVLDEVLQKLYPPETGVKNFYRYNDTISRAATIIADYLLNCNVQALLAAFNPNKSSAYFFAEGAGLHGEEAPYIYYNDGPTRDNFGFGQVNGTVALGLQDWMVTFVATGSPQGPGNPPIPVFGDNQTLGLMSNEGLGSPIKDSALKERCDFWRSAVYY